MNFMFSWIAFVYTIEASIPPDDHLIPADLDRTVWQASPDADGAAGRCGPRSEIEVSALDREAAEAAFRQRFPADRMIRSISPG
jgi:hypothetical protein